MICEAGNFLSRDAITGFQCICTMLCLVDNENKSCTFDLLFEAFVMNVQFKLEIQNISQTC